MTKSKFILPAMLVAAAMGGAGTLALPAQPAQAQAANPAPQGAPPPARTRPMRPRESHIEGRIAYLKAELKITPAQEAQFDKLAQAMRQNDAERRRAFEQARTDRGQARPNAMQLLERRARFSAMRAQQTERTLAAFRPLYDSLSPDQKKVADDLAMPHFHGRHRGRI
ncbi:MAG TPA: Spy/CpxP family protein refolding chaperone [Stellaceae bacterium]|nr:Spy/CpxP family protein refolding chaperone [Stellaceae bacterium]